MLKKLIATATISGTSQIFFSLGSAYLAQHLPASESVAFIQIESYFQVASSIAFIGLTLELYRLSAENKVKSDNFEQSRGLLLIISFVLILIGVLLYFIAENKNYALAMFAASFSGISLESALYGQAMPTLAAGMSALKSSVPILFVYISNALDLKIGSAVVFLAGIASIYLISYFICCSYLDIAAAPKAWRLSGKKYFTLVASGMGPVSNAMQRSAPVAIFSTFGNIEQTMQLFTYFKLLNLYWGGLRVISQVYTRKFLSQEFAGKATLVISISTIVACFLFYLFPVRNNLPIKMTDWLWIALFFTCIATSLGIGFNIRLLLARQDRVYFLINFFGLVLVSILSYIFVEIKQENLVKLLLSLGAIELAISFLLYRKSGIVTKQLALSP
ncbi:hypothetical protein [Polaromonas jejuensis]|uniref:Polysaccharide biosynthesis protein n=1 Tax=Polaromonas jejuensis TaxID=457502 RepID=A0ABW0Q8L2_9BURK|nr:hypothetical protein [Polaromonas jejuensis]